MEKSSFPRHHGPKCYSICMQMTYDAEGISVCANECWQHTPSLREMSLYLKFSEPIDYPSLCSPTDVNNWILPSGLHLGLRHFQITWTGHKHRKNIRVHFNTAILCAYECMLYFRYGRSVQWKTKLPFSLSSFRHNFRVYSQKTVKIILKYSQHF